MKIVIGTLAVTLIAGLVAGLLIIQAGMFNVSTTWQDPAVWRWLLTTVREESIERRSAGIEIPDLAARAMITRGFQSYRDMCAGCHGKPGGAPSPLAQGLNPPPPDLSDPEYKESTREVFWVVKNGIRMTGMPGWGATHSDDALWDIVAFVNALPGITPAEYRAMESESPEGHHHSHEHQADAGNASLHTPMEDHHTH